MSFAAVHDVYAYGQVVLLRDYNTEHELYSVVLIFKPPQRHPCRYEMMFYDRESQEIAFDMLDSAEGLLEMMDASDDIRAVYEPVEMH